MDSVSARNKLQLSTIRLRHCEVMEATLRPPRLLPSGDSAITVEFSRQIDDAANQRVLALDRAMSAASIAGVTETVPTYRSLLVHYDPWRQAAGTCKNPRGAE
jgi:5-oxoprolinase (ATP-hydrolysing) subunit B